MTKPRKDFLSSIKMRRADKSDCIDLFKWRNDPETRKNSVNGTDEVPLEDHIKWFKSKLKDPKTRLYIGISGKNKVGLMRFDIGGDIIKVGTNVNPAFRGMGVGSRIMDLTTGRIYREFKKLIVAEIRNDNIASIKMCAKNGYAIERKAKGITYMYFNGDDALS
ncbi:MAG: GNAT family N-acetyltransferase [Candidatus Omnitrophota bacterium]|nr:GNAT family N-acetyltransferase [Candidatus Omnitrophota bacterium]